MVNEEAHQKEIDTWEREQGTRIYTDECKERLLNCSFYRKNY